MDFFSSVFFEISSIFLLVVKSWNRQHHGQTIHPTKKLISMNLFKINQWAWLFFTSMAVRCQKCYKGQIISKANCQALNSSKKWTNEFVFTTMKTQKRNFEINWLLTSAHFGTLTQCSVHPTLPLLLIKINK